jgi:NAD(P)H-dependent FMN reductase
MTKKIITLGGSSSKTSINKTLAEYTGSLINGVELIKIDLNDFDLPLYSVDVENASGIAEAANELNKIFEKADGFVISLAEHNGAYSTAFKNAFDWLSRINGKVWRNKPMLLLSTSPGERGGQSVLDIALARFPYMGGNIVGSLALPSFNDNFMEGEIVNTALKSKLQKLVIDLEKAL